MAYLSILSFPNNQPPTTPGRKAESVCVCCVCINKSARERREKRKHARGKTLSSSSSLSLSRSFASSSSSSSRCFISLLFESFSSALVSLPKCAPFFPGNPKITFFIKTLNEFRFVTEERARLHSTIECDDDVGNNDDENDERAVLLLRADDDDDGEEE